MSSHVTASTGKTTLVDFDKDTFPTSICNTFPKLFTRHVYLFGTMTRKMTIFVARMSRSVWQLALSVVQFLSECKLATKRLDSYYFSKVTIHFIPLLLTRTCTQLCSFPLLVENFDDNFFLPFFAFVRYCLREIFYMRVQPTKRKECIQL